MFLQNFVALLLLRINKKKKAAAYDDVEMEPSERLTEYASIPIQRENMFSLPRGTLLDRYIDDKYELDGKDLVIEQEIGSGAFGTVYKGMWRGIPVAIKQMKNNITDEVLMEFASEATLMKNMRSHSNVVLFFGVCRDPLSLVTEFMENGSLWGMLQSDKPMNMVLKLQIIRDIAAGMYHLQLEKVVHKDLAARNILLDRNFTAKVSDFGLSRLSERSENVVYSITDTGPIRWLAPECMKKKVYSVKSDIWAFGVTCIEILTRKQPYDGMDMVSVSGQVVYEGMTLEGDIPERTPQHLADVIRSTFRFEAEDRPDFKAVCDALAPTTNK